MILLKRHGVERSNYEKSMTVLKRLLTTALGWHPAMRHLIVKRDEDERPKDTVLFEERRSCIFCKFDGKTLQVFVSLVPIITKGAVIEMWLAFY